MNSKYLDPYLTASIHSYVQALDKAYSKYQDVLYEKHPQNKPSHNIECQYGEKFVRLVRDGSVVGFIALQTFSNKSLGNVEVGDVFKFASWHRPAKGKRDSIFNATYNIHRFGIIPYSEKYNQRYKY